MVIVGSGAGGKVVGRLGGTVVVVRRSSGATLVVVVVGTGAGSIGVEVLAGTLVEVLAGTLVVVVAVNRGAVSGRLSVTGTGTGTAIADLIYSLDLLTLPSVFL